MSSFNSSCRITKPLWYVKLLTCVCWENTKPPHLRLSCLDCVILVCKQQPWKSIFWNEFGTIYSFVFNSGIKLIQLLCSCANRKKKETSWAEQGHTQDQLLAFPFFTSFLISFSLLYIFSFSFFLSFLFPLFPTFLFLLLFSFFPFFFLSFLLFILLFFFPSFLLDLHFNFGEDSSRGCWDINNFQSIQSDGWVV